MIVAKLISCYIFWTLRYGIPPWRFFQLNAKYFNAEKGFYSKLEIDDLIPEQWRVVQTQLNIENKPEAFPVFLKPEWGQNSYGIQLVQNQEDFEAACDVISDSKITYIVQQLARGKKEFEIFYIQDPDHLNDFVSFTITEVVNDKEDFPINAVYNQNTLYKDRTDEFSKEELQTLKSYVKLLPHFKIARVAVKTENKESLIAAKFDIIEINLFAPMPIHLLDSKHSDQFRNKFIIKNMEQLAIISGKASKQDFKSFLFYKIVRRHYQLK